VDRRRFLSTAIVASTGGAVLPTLRAVAVGAQTAQPGTSPYGPLAAEPDPNGLLLPEGFTSRIIAVAGEPIAGTDYRWLAFPDGAATFETDDGGWIYTVNSEVFSFHAPTPSGGVSAVRFDADGEVVDAYRILEGSHSNCAGGPTPWGTWLSCEEDFADEQGLVYECDPTGERSAVVHEAMGRWAHEAVAVDPESETLYLTQDHPNGLLYRYTPDSYPDLSSGLLEACTVGSDGSVSWQVVPDPSGRSAPTR
jgi:secreted PhoX family phosphatase